MKAARSRSSLENPSRLRSWVLRIAWNVFHDHVRREHVLRDKNVSGEELDQLQGTQHFPLGGDLEEQLELDGQLFDVGEMVELLRCLIGELSATERGLYTAFYTEGLGCASAAERLGTSHRGVKMRLVRLRRKLRRNIRQRVAVTSTRPGRALEVVAC